MENTLATDHAKFMADLLSGAKESRDQFPAHRLENLRKQAKELLSEFKQGDPEALRRFNEHHPNFPKENICLADAQSVIAREQRFPSWPKMKSALGQSTVADEVARVHKKLRAEGREHLVPIITEESLKGAILKGIQSYDAHPIEPQWQEGYKYWESDIRPMLLKIVETGDWPENALVDLGYEQTDEHGVTYQGLGASLEIRTSNTRYPGFSLAILDLWYGRF